MTILAARIRHYIILLTSTLLFQSPFYAHDQPQLHKLCKGSFDYFGCIQTNKSLTNNLSNYSENQIMWRQYGDLKINWSRWRSKSNNHIAPAVNKSNQPLYIAINCQAQMINTTGLNSVWKGWLSPSADFERKLIADLCGLINFSS